MGPKHFIEDVQLPLAHNWSSTANIDIVSISLKKSDYDCVCTSPTVYIYLRKNNKHPGICLHTKV